MAKPTMLAVSGQRELIDQRRAVHVDQGRINDFDALGYVGDSVERPLQLVGNSDVGLGKAMRRDSRQARRNADARMVEGNRVERQTVGAEDGMDTDDGAEIVNLRDLGAVQ